MLKKRTEKFTFQNHGRAIVKSVMLEDITLLAKHIFWQTKYKTFFKASKKLKRIPKIRIDLRQESKKKKSKKNQKNPKN